MLMKRRGIDALPNLERKGFNAESESFALKPVGILQGLNASLGEKRVGCRARAREASRAGSLLAGRLTYFRLGLF